MAESRCPACGAAAPGVPCARCGGDPPCDPARGGAPLAPLPAGGVGAFLAGVETCLAGFRVVRATPALRALALAPALVNLVLLAGLFWGVLAVRPLVSEWIAPGGSGVTGFLADLGALVAAVVAALLLHPILASVVASPFNEALSAAVERAVRGKPEEEKFALSRFAADVFRPIGQALRVASFRLGATILLLPLALVPVAGPAVAFLVSAAFASYDYLDLPTSRVRMSYAEKRALARRHRAATLGFGVVAQALLIVPIVNVFLLPAAVAGGTVLYFRMRK